MNNIEHHKSVCDALNEIYAKKNADYGNSFTATYEKLGPISAVTRISDKYERLCNLITKPEEERQVKSESIMDTVFDMANYCIMLYMELEKGIRKV